MKRVVLIGVLIIEIALAVILLPGADRTRLQSTDFVNFYAAASIVRQGKGAVLYRRETQDPVLQSILGHNSNQYFLHPPFEAAALVPLSYLKIEQAFVVWSLINAGLLGILPLVLIPCVPAVATRPYLGLLGFAFLPALTALTLGQDSILLLFIMSSAYLLICKNLEVVAGLVLALATIKFQYLLILLPMLLLWRKLRVMAGFALGGAFLVFVSWVIVGSGGLIEYIRFVRSFDLHSGYGGLNQALMVNWRGFLAGIERAGPSPAYFWGGEIILVLPGLLCLRVPQTARIRALIFALFISVAVAASPYAHFPDMTMLLLPAFLAGSNVQTAPGKTIVQKLLAFCCVSLFVWPLLLLVLGGHYWWNSRIYLTFPVLLLFIVSLGFELLVSTVNPWRPTREANRMPLYLE
jgi:Glycosyltransferase family 87